MYNVHQITATDMWNWIYYVLIKVDSILLGYSGLLLVLKCPSSLNLVCTTEAIRNHCTESHIYRDAIRVTEYT